MSEQLEYDLSCQRRRWVAYFDLLGSRNLIESKDPSRVFAVYSEAIERAIKQCEVHACIQYAWFSDTFLIYTESDLGADFAALEQVARWFVCFLLQAEIPVRGAVACGDFYADTHNHLFFGKALIEAYKHGEAQDWIGFVLCPSADARLDEVGLPAGSLRHYACREIPFKEEPKRSPRKPSPQELYACILGEWVRENGKNPLIAKLRRMQQQASEESIARKYKNTIGFIEGKR